MKIIVLIAALSAAWIALPSFAGGTHTGGHPSGAETSGQLGQAAKVGRTIVVYMTDTMRFSPMSVSAQEGETIRFIVKNSGKIRHEMVFGTEKELKEHGEAMKNNPEMEHTDENMVMVPPGASGEIIWQFTKTGKVHFACLQPGHYDAGMKGVVTVGSSISISTPSASIGAAIAPQLSSMATGEIRKVDKNTKKITIKHGEIKNLQMPGMTMVFQVKNPAMLDTVKTGDKVAFTAEKLSGAMVVTHIQPLDTEPAATEEHSHNH